MLPAEGDLNRQTTDSESDRTLLQKGIELTLRMSLHLAWL